MKKKIAQFPVYGEEGSKKSYGIATLHSDGSLSIEIPPGAVFGLNTDLVSCEQIKGFNISYLCTSFKRGMLRFIPEDGE